MSYIIKNEILVTLSTYDRFVEGIHDIPFSSEGRRQPP